MTFPARCIDPRVKVPELVVVPPERWTASQRRPCRVSRPLKRLTSPISETALASRVPAFTTPEVAVAMPPEIETPEGSPIGETVVMASANGALVARALIRIRFGTPRTSAVLPFADAGSSVVTMTGCGWSSEARVGSAPLQPSPASVTPMTPRFTALLWALAPVFWCPATDSPAVMPKLRFPNRGLTL